VLADKIETAEKDGIENPTVTITRDRLDAELKKLKMIKGE
jgi:hypothetical protein